MTVEETHDRIAEVVIEGLLGSTDGQLTLSLSNPDHLTVLCGINGSGKTTALRIINGVLNSDLDELERLVFRKVLFKTLGGQELSVERQELSASEEGLDRSRRLPSSIRHHDLVFTLKRPSNKRLQHWTAAGSGSYGSGADLLAWRARQLRNEMVHHADKKNSEIYGQYLEQLRGISLASTLKDVLEDTKGVPAPSWLSSFVQEHSCMYIPASRKSASPRMSRANLRVSESSTDSQSTDDSPLAERSHQLVALARDARQQYARQAAQFDRLFLSQLLELVRIKVESSPSQQELSEEWKRTRDTQRQLVRFGLVDGPQTGENLDDRIPTGDTERRIFHEYCSITLAKMSAFDAFRVPWEQLVDTINTGLLDPHDKQLDADATHGFRFRKYHGAGEKASFLDFRDLSSGEQQELILQFDQTFGTRPGGLLLVDEPEISLHVDWQKRYLDDLERVANARGFYCVVATHSPTVLNGHGDSAVQLGRR